METNTLILISMAVIVIFIFAIGIILEKIIEHNHRESEKVIKKYIDGCVKANPKTGDRQLTIPVVVNRRELLLDFADYSESDKTSQTTDECVDNYLDSIK